MNIEIYKHVEINSSVARKLPRKPFIPHRVGRETRNKARENCEQHKAIDSFMKAKRRMGSLICKIHHAALFRDLFGN